MIKVENSILVHTCVQNDQGPYKTALTDWRALFRFLLESTCDLKYRAWTLRDDRTTNPWTVGLVSVDPEKRACSPAKKRSWSYGFFGGRMKTPKAALHLIGLSPSSWVSLSLAGSCSKTGARRTRTPVASRISSPKRHFWRISLTRSTANSHASLADKKFSGNGHLRCSRRYQV